MAARWVVLAALLNELATVTLVTEAGAELFGWSGRTGPVPQISC